MDSPKETISMIGGLLGLIAFFWKIGDAFVSYLHLDVKIERAPDVGTVSALASIENKGAMAKPLHYAALLVGPEEESLKEVAGAIARAIDRSEESGSNPMQALFTHHAEQPIYADDGAHALIPLPLLFRDQIQIGNEVIRCRRSIDTSRLAAGASYVVILVVFIRYPLGILRWRITSDLLRIASA